MNSSAIKRGGNAVLGGEGVHLFLLEKEKRILAGKKLHVLGKKALRRGREGKSQVTI